MADTPTPIEISGPTWTAKPWVDYATKRKRLSIKGDHEAAYQYLKQTIDPAYKNALETEVKRCRERGWSNPLPGTKKSRKATVKEADPEKPTFGKPHTAKRGKK